MNLTSYYDEFKIFQSEIEAGIIRLISETKSVPHSAYEHWQAFSHAVNWQQTWIRMILSFHVGLYVLAYCTRQNVNIQSVIFFLIIIIVGFLERINNFCANNWRIFSDQNYFDKHGVFAGVVVAMPLLALGFFQLIHFLLLTSKLLIKVKRLEIAHHKKLQVSNNTAGKIDPSSGYEGEVKDNKS